MATRDHRKYALCFFQHQDGHSDIIWLSKKEEAEDNEKFGSWREKRVKAAHLGHLLGYLTLGVPDDHLLHEFILTYPSLPMLGLTPSHQNEDQKLTSMDLLNLLLARWEGPSDKAAEYQTYLVDQARIRVGVRSFLQKWIELIKHDWEANGHELLDHFENWLDSTSSHEIFHDLLAPFQAQKAKPSLSLRRGSRVDTSGVKFTDFILDDVAAQWSVIEFHLFRQIEPKELLGQAWTKPEKSLAPHIASYLDFFNRMSGWCSSEIIKVEDQEERAAVITKMIDLARKLKELQNYGGLMAVLLGLNHGAITRLKATWKVVPKIDVYDFEKMSELTDTKRNFSNYRNDFKPHFNLETTKAVIPFLAVTLSDFFFYHEGNPTLIDHDLINVHKIRLMGEDLYKIRHLQSVPYKFIQMSTIVDYLLNVDFWSTDDIHRVSKLREPGESRDPSAMSTISPAKRRIGRTGSMFGNANFGSMTIDNNLEPSPLSDRDWKILLSCAKEVKYKKGDTIVEEGDFNRFLFKIKEGRVKVIKQQNSDQEAILRRLAEGDIFGEAALVNNYVNTATAAVVAESEVVVYAMPEGYLNSIFESTPRIAKRFFFTVARRSALILEELSLESVNSRDSVVEKAPVVVTGTLKLKVNKTRQGLTDIFPEEAKIKLNASMGGSGADEIISSLVTPSNQSSFERLLQELSSPNRSIDPPPIRRAQSEGVSTDERTSPVMSASLSPLRMSTSAKEEQTFFMRDAKLNERFGLEGQLVLQEFPCVLKKALINHGDVILTQKYICFTAKKFGKRYKKVISFPEINEISVNKEERTVSVRDKEKTSFVFEDPELDMNSIEGFFKGLWFFNQIGGGVWTSKELNAMNSPDNNSPFMKSPRRPENYASLRQPSQYKQFVAEQFNPTERSQLKAKADQEFLTEEDWSHLVGGCKTKKFQAGETIIEFGETYQRLYQITQGRCTIRSKKHSASEMVIREPDTFGERTFLIWETGSSVQVEALTEVTLYIIEGHFVSILFRTFPGFAGRFYRYLSAIMLRRLRNHDRLVHKM